MKHLYWRWAEERRRTDAAAAGHQGSNRASRQQQGVKAEQSVEAGAGRQGSRASRQQQNQSTCAGLCPHWNALWVVLPSPSTNALAKRPISWQRCFPSEDLFFTTVIKQHSACERFPHTSRHSRLYSGRPHLLQQPAQVCQRSLSMLAPAQDASLPLDPTRSMSGRCASPLLSCVALTVNGLHTGLRLSSTASVLNTGTQWPASVERLISKNGSLFDMTCAVTARVIRPWLALVGFGKLRHDMRPLLAVW
eukprot:356921-Chlamydomonas_euryale.AAC.3